MRLFGKVDNAINRFDRAMYLSIPFDLAFQLAVSGPFCVAQKTVTASVDGCGVTTSFVGQDAAIGGSVITKSACC